MKKNQEISMKSAISILCMVLGVLLLSSLGVLSLVNGKLSSFEKNTPEGIFSSYMVKVSEQKYDQLYEEFQSRTQSLSSKEDFSQAIQEIYQDVNFDELSYVKENKTTSSMEGPYGVYGNGKKIATLNLVQENNKWQVETLINGGTLSYLVEIPSDATVQINGITLDETYLKESNVASAGYRHMTNQDNAPKVNRYEITNMMSAPTITLDGYTSMKDALEDQLYVGKVLTGDLKDSTEKLLLNIGKSASLFATSDGSLGTLTGYFINDCDFVKRIKTMDNQWFTTHSGHSFANETVTDVIQIADDSIIGNVNFDYTIESNTYGNRVYHVGYQISLLNVNGTWKAVDLIVNNPQQ